MEKTIDYYMSLPYTVEFECDGTNYTAFIRELPLCAVTVAASDSVEKLWWLSEP